MMASSRRENAASKRALEGMSHSLRRELMIYGIDVVIINPGEFSPASSIEAVLWVAVGGRGTLTGAVVGAILVNYAKTTFTSGPLAPYWLFMLGGLFVAVTLLLPRGIVGTFQHWWEERRARADGDKAVPAEPVPRPAE